MTSGSQSHVSIIFCVLWLHYKTRESDKWGLKWAENEPLHECVTLNTISGTLVTRSCGTELPYVCHNNGFPIYPVAGSLACPKDWFFFYQNPLTEKNCVKPFKVDSTAQFLYRPKKHARRLKAKKQTLTIILNYIMNSAI
ncbi:hypothetical protein HNY73_022067 [Argiope bruennichi]|uniref:Uncharacterized protein n=1 Tax=Argiope bruennichi TaxID=94029 RepID=A0A8T0E3D1_ARGBR|nr:hypothetical protein HNY73_022067 [Argiope bruennichi]